MKRLELAITLACALSGTALAFMCRPCRTSTGSNTDRWHSIGLRHID